MAVYCVNLPPLNWKKWKSRFWKAGSISCRRRRIWRQTAARSCTSLQSLAAWRCVWRVGNGLPAVHNCHFHHLTRGPGCWQWSPSPALRCASQPRGHPPSQAPVASSSVFPADHQEMAEWYLRQGWQVRWQATCCQIPRQATCWQMQWQASVGRCRGRRHARRYSRPSDHRCNGRKWWGDRRCDGSWCHARRCHARRCVCRSLASRYDGKGGRRVVILVLHVSLGGFWLTLNVKCVQD